MIAPEQHGLRPDVGRGRAAGSRRSEQAQAYRLKGHPPMVPLLVLGAPCLLLPKFLLFGELTTFKPGDPVARLLPTIYPALPDRNTSATDNLSVWMQRDSPYGQLDGSIKEPIS